MTLFSARRTQMKNILNITEAATESRLKQVCSRHGARVFSKVRLADVLPIEGSRISKALFRYALQAHFDFVVTDEDTEALFGVEYDGSSHQRSEVRQRDVKKNKLCALFEFPLLRIKTTYLHELSRQKDLLSWFVEVWFAADGFYEAQERGDIPRDEPFSPWAVMRPSSGDTYPLQLSSTPLQEIRTYYDEGRCEQAVPSTLIAKDGDGNYRGIGFLQVSESGWIAIWSGMQSQQFPVLESDALDEILILELHGCLQRVLSGDEEAEPEEAVSCLVDDFVNRYNIVSVSLSGAPAGFSMSF